MSPSLRRLAFALVVVLVVVPTAGASLVADDPVTPTPEACESTSIIVIDYAQNPEQQDFDSPAVARYGNLTADQRALFDRGYDSLGTEVPVDERAWTRGRDVPSLVVRNDSVYRFKLALDDCPLVRGIPQSFNGVVSVYLTLGFVVTGPLAPLLFVGVGIGAAAWLGKKIEY